VRVPSAQAQVPDGERRIVALAYEGASTLDLFGVLEPFTRAVELSGERPYRIAIVSQSGGAVRLNGGVPVLTESLGAGAAPDTVIVPGGPGLVRWTREPGALSRARGLCRSARRICGLGGGVFALAAARLLDGRRVATRWDVSDELARQYPQAIVDRDPTFVRDGETWTAAGGACALDVALAMVEDDLGRALAVKAARQMVVYARRAPSQPQLSALLAAQGAPEGPFERLHNWIAANLDADLRVEQLAARVGMSPRSFSRHYTRTMGAPPARVVERLRLEAARQAVELGAESLACIAHRFGFGSEDTFRRAFAKYHGRPPRDYRTPVAI
jgi:transcriptional regulator GlxA family with amidase domain